MVDVSHLTSETCPTCLGELRIIVTDAIPGKSRMMIGRYSEPCPTCNGRGVVGPNQPKQQTVWDRSTPERRSRRNN